MWTRDRDSQIINLKFSLIIHLYLWNEGKGPL